MKALVLMSFYHEKYQASTGQVIEIEDEKVFLDLHAAGFVEQVDRVSEVKDSKAEVRKAKAEKPDTSK